MEWDQSERLQQAQILELQQWCTVSRRILAVPHRNLRSCPGQLVISDAVALWIDLGQCAEVNRCKIMN